MPSQPRLRLAYSEYLGSTARADALSSWPLVLHHDLLSILDFNFLPALHTVGLWHGCSSFSDVVCVAPARPRLTGCTVCTISIAQPTCQAGVRCLTHFHGLFKCRAARQSLSFCPASHPRRPGSPRPSPTRRGLTTDEKRPRIRQLWKGVRKGKDEGNSTQPQEVSWASRAGWIEYNTLKTIIINENDNSFGLVEREAMMWFNDITQRRATASFNGSKLMSDTR